MRANKGDPVFRTCTWARGCMGNREPIAMKHLLVFTRIELVHAVVNIVSSAAVKPRLDSLCLILIVPIIKIGRYASVFFSFDVRKVYFGSTICTLGLGAQPICLFVCLDQLAWTGSRSFR